VRDKALERDNYTCQDCGKSKDDIGRNPDVHHKKPVKNFENQNDAHTISNLVCLCMDCHKIREQRI